MVGFCERWARILIHRYNEGGEEKLIDQRKNNAGQTPFLDENQCRKLKKIILEEKPKDKGLWTGPKVAEWIEKETGRSITDAGAWHWIRRLGFTLQVPRPRNIKSATEEEVKDFKKNWTLSL